MLFRSHKVMLVYRAHKAQREIKAIQDLQEPVHKARKDIKASKAHKETKARSVIMDPRDSKGLTAPELKVYKVRKEAWDSLGYVGHKAAEARKEMQEFKALKVTPV